MIEEWLKVGHRLHVMHVMLRSTTDQPKGPDPMRAERQVKTDVRLHADPDAEHHIAPCRHRMAAEKPAIGGRQKPDGD